MNKSTIVKAKDYIDPDGVITASANLISAAIISALKDNSIVYIALAEMPAISSTYFNIIFYSAASSDIDLKRIMLANSTHSMAGIFNRSKKAIMDNHSRVK